MQYSIGMKIPIEALWLRLVHRMPILVAYVTGKVALGLGGAVVVAGLLVAPVMAAPVAPPTTPGNFQATTTSGTAVITLSWTASSAAYGIRGYTIERSLDQVNWQLLASSVTAVSYNDTTTAFGVHYYYRISAVDPSGQASGYAYADVVTNAFSANVSTQNGGTIFNSPDGIVSVTVPAGAMPNNAACSVQLIGISGGGQPGGADHSVVAGPYELLCKTPDGNSVVTFSSPIQWQFNLKGALKGLANPLPHQYVGNVASENPLIPGAVFYAAKSQLTFAYTSDNPVMVAAETTGGLPIDINVVVILVAVGLLILGIALIATKRQQKNSDADYVRHKYYNL